MASAAICGRSAGQPFSQCTWPGGVPKCIYLARFKICVCHCQWLITEICWCDQQMLQIRGGISFAPIASKQLNEWMSRDAVLSVTDRPIARPILSALATSGLHLPSGIMSGLSQWTLIAMTLCARLCIRIRIHFSCFVYLIWFANRDPVCRVKYISTNERTDTSVTSESCTSQVTKYVNLT